MLSYIVRDEDAIKFREVAFFDKVSPATFSPSINFKLEAGDLIECFDVKGV
jgi:hypothetical protein